MRKSLRAVFALLTAGLALAACNSSGIWVTDLARPDSHGLYAWAASKGDLRVVVLGNPFDVAKAELESAVVDALDSVPPGGPLGTNSTTPRPGSRTAIRFVFAFDPPRNMSAYALCREDIGFQPAPSPDTLRTLISFCDGGTLQASSAGQLRRPAGPRDDSFLSLIGNGVWSMVQHPDPTIDADCANFC